MDQLYDMGEDIECGCRRGTEEGREDRLILLSASPIEFYHSPRLVHKIYDI